MGNFVTYSFTGRYNAYGNAQKGWLELLSSGTLTISGAEFFDLYVLGPGTQGGPGGTGVYKTEDANGNTVTNYYYRGGAGGAPGRMKTYWIVRLDGSYEVTIPSAIPWENTGETYTTLGEYTSAKGDRYGDAEVDPPHTDNDDADTYGTWTVIHDGEQPFVLRDPITGASGFATRKLNAMGGMGQDASGGVPDTYRLGGEGGGGNGANSARAGYPATANTGSGGGGGYCKSAYGNATAARTDYAGGAGSEGIVIVRWGYTMSLTMDGTAAGSTLVNGASQNIIGGNTVVGGAQYEIQSGSCVEDGSSKKISLGSSGGLGNLVVVLDNYSAVDGSIGSYTGKECELEVNGKAYTMALHTSGASYSEEIPCPIGTQFTVKCHATKNLGTIKVINGVTETTLKTDSNNSNLATFSVNGYCMVYMYSTTAIEVYGDVETVSHTYDESLAS